MKQNISLLLASQSKARADMLSGAGLKFLTRPVDLDETAIRINLQREDCPPDQIAIKLACEKSAAAALKGTKKTGITGIIGADQILECDSVLYEKPGDLQGVRRQLQSLRGKTHYLHSAVSIVSINTNNVKTQNTPNWHHVDSVAMTMRDFGDDFIEDYLETANADIVNCVGGYQLEGVGARLFERIEGDYFSVLGLPLLALLSYLRTIGAIDQG